MTKTITLNGKSITLEQSDTIADFTMEMKITGTMYVIEKNGKIVNKEDYAAEPVVHGDVLELVGLVGGG